MQKISGLSPATTRIGSKFRMAVRWKLNIRIGSFRPAVSIKRQINPKLQIDGILLTMVDSRTNFAKEISALLRETYGSKIKVFGTEIPHSVRAKEISAEGKSIFAHDPGGKVAEGYRNLTKEVLKLEKQREKK